jgi:hypothetical protein
MKDFRNVFTAFAGVKRASATVLRGQELPVKIRIRRVLHGIAPGKM